MGVKIGGVAYLKVDGEQLPLRGNFTISPSMLERTGVAGQDGVHGFIEMPRVPWMEGDITLDPGVSVEDIDGITNATVTAELNNGHVYVLREAWCRANEDINSRDGQVRVRFEGMAAYEMMS